MASFSAISGSHLRLVLPLCLLIAFAESVIPVSGEAPALRVGDPLPDVPGSVVTEIHGGELRPVQIDPPIYLSCPEIDYELLAARVTARLPEIPQLDQPLLIDRVSGAVIAAMQIEFAKLDEAMKQPPQFLAQSGSFTIEVSHHVD